MNALQRIAGGAATALAVLLLAAPASADGMRRGGMKEAAPEPRRCTLSANVGITSDYVFRGYSQSAEGAAIQGGFDATCGMFYAGVWASSVNFGDWDNSAFDVNGFPINASMELDVYAGIKGTAGRFAWDLGVIYYTYPNRHNPGLEMSYVEFKAGATTEVWKGGTVGATVFYSPDYQLESGATWTLEGSFSQTLPTIMGRITPTFSALVGWQKNDGSASYLFSYGNGEDSYMYWNAGLTLALDKNWSVDVRYWDTNLSDNVGGSAFCKGSVNQCDERVVGTLKFTY